MAPRPRNGLSLCSGGAGLDLGVMLAEPGFHTRCFVEWDEYPRSTIIAAQRAGYLAPAPIWDDLTKFDARPFRGAFDTLLAGYPCQPFSHAGQRKGEDDERHLWPDIERIAEELTPADRDDPSGLRWIFLENVAGHVTLGAETVLRALWRLGFTPAAGLFTAAEVGAPHKRERWFCVAYREGGRRQIGKRRPFGECEGKDGEGMGAVTPRSGRDEMADADGRNPGPERQQRGGKLGFQSQGRGIGKDGRRPLHNPTGARCNPEGQRAGSDLESGERLFGEGRDNLADASQPGSQGRERAGTLGQRDRSQAHGPITELRRPRLFPPGPSDRDGWIAAHAMAPDLAPAVAFGDIADRAGQLAQMVAAGELAEAQAEPELCRMVDGMAARTRALKLLGNGVVPLVAGYAWRTLSAAHGLRPMDLEAAERDGRTEADGI